MLKKTQFIHFLSLEEEQILQNHSEVERINAVCVNVTDNLHVSFLCWKKFRGRAIISILQSIQTVS